MPSRPTYKRRKHRRREVDGGFEYQCNTCRLWLTEFFFQKRTQTRWGIYSDCKSCKARKEAKAGYRPTLVKRRVKRMKARERIANEVYEDKRDVPQRFQHRQWATTPKLIEAATTVLRRYPVEDDVLDMTGVHARMLRSFLDGTGRNMSIKTAEKLALVLDDMELIDEFLPDWNRAGLKRCIECGTNVHPHQGKGRCRLCYHREYYGVDDRTKGRARWSQLHECCIGCGTSERKHDANGYCHRCIGRIKSHGAPITMKLCVCGCGRRFELNDKRRIYFSGSCKTAVHKRKRAVRGKT